MSSQMMMRRTAVGLACVLALSGCASPSGIRAPFEENMSLVEGPAIEDIVTPFDRALACLDGRLSNKLTFSVGAILDSTGKEQLSEGGVGKFVTQGAGDIVQSALFQAGTTVVNRRDPRIMETETKWGLYSAKNVIPSMFFITGSINSLDFIPGGGFEAQVAGIGPRYRQHRILIGMDLSMTETKSGRVVANVPLHKQIVASEVGFGVGRFFGETLVSLDVGNQNREAVHFAMRQMLNLATFELLTQVMRPESYADCRAEIQAVHGVIGSTKTSKRIAQFQLDKGGVVGGAAEALDVPKAPDAPKAGVVSPIVKDAAAGAVGSAKEPSIKGKKPAEGVALPSSSLVGGVAPLAVPAGVTNVVGDAAQAPVAVAGSPAQPPVLSASVLEKTSAEKAAVEKVAAEKASAEKVAAEKAAAEKVAAEKAAAEKVAAEKAAAEKVAAEKAAAEKVAAEKAATEKAAAEKAATEKAAAEKAATEKAAAEKAAAEKAAAEKAAAEKVAAEKAAAEKAAAEKEVAEKVVDEKVEAKEAAAAGVSAPAAETAGASVADGAQAGAPAQQRYFSDEQAPIQPNAIRALELPVKTPDVAPDHGADDRTEGGPSSHNEAPGTAPSEPLTSSVPVTLPASASSLAAVLPVAARPQGATVAQAAAAPKPYVDKLIEPETCVMPKGQLPAVKAPRASKDGSMFFVSAPLDTTLCVADASGKLWSHRFERSKGRSFHGTPPWSLQSPYLNEMQIYFQGWKLASVADGVERIRLVERELD